MREIWSVYKVQIVCNYAGDPKCASRIHRRLLTTAPSSLATVANWHHGKWFKFDIRSSTGWYLLQSPGILVSIKRFQMEDKVTWSEEKEHTYVEGCNKSWKRKVWITFLKKPSALLWPCPMDILRKDQNWLSRQYCEDDFETMGRQGTCWPTSTQGHLGVYQWPGEKGKKYSFEGTP